MADTDDEYNTFCPACGLGVDVDDDGCCKLCGATATGVEASRVAALLYEKESRATTAEARAREVEQERDALLTAVEALDAAYAAFEADESNKHNDAINDRADDMFAVAAKVREGAGNG